MARSPSSRSAGSRLRRYGWVVALVFAAALLAPATARATAGAAAPVSPYGGLNPLSVSQRASLLAVARDTWKFYGPDVDQATSLPMDNITFAGGSATPTSYGRYTSSANIGVYLWAVVSARDLGLISESQARARLTATLTEVSHLKRFDGFLYQWYDTTNGNVLTNPGQGDCTETTPAFDNCFFVSNVDNGWYASGLIVVRQAMPSLARLADSLIQPMNFGLFYDDRAETHCNVNPAVTGNQPTGQMFGGYYAGLPPEAGDNWTHYYHNGALYSDPRISAYIGMGLHQMPGNVWWRSWRELPPPAGGMFEGLMPNEIVPETSWGTRSFGLADARTAQVQIKYATQQLGYPVWGMSPSSTADDTGDYGGYGAEGLKFPYYGTGANASHPNEGLSQDHGGSSETVVTPHASFLALDVAPQQAYANITALRSHFPGVYGADGFFDAVNPVTGSVGHRDLVLDQSMIMAALDNALRDRALQRDFARDPVSWAAHTYLSMETMSIAG
jgi:hypothetical protein